MARRSRTATGLGGLLQRWKPRPVPGHAQVPARPRPRPAAAPVNCSPIGPLNRAGLACASRPAARGRAQLVGGERDRAGATAIGGAFEDTYGVWSAPAENFPCRGLTSQNSPPRLPSAAPDRACQCASYSHFSTFTEHQDCCRRM